MKGASMTSYEMLNGRVMAWPTTSSHRDDRAAC